MSITDELREWFKDRFFMANGWQEIHAIADRIDAEHESACAEAYGNGVMSVPIALDESAWVELPKDADGEYIHLGDRLEHINGEFTVNDMTVSVDGLWRAWDGENGHTVLLAKCRHYHAPTVEDVLREFTDAILEWAGKSGTVAEVGTWSDVAAEYAKRLTLAEGEDA